MDLAENRRVIGKIGGEKERGKMIIIIFYFEKEKY